MADIKSKFGANGQAITITLASLANASARQSTEVDNSVNRFLDALVTLKLKGGSGVISGGMVSVYAFGTVNGGTTRTENAGASDAGITLAVPTNLRFLGAINVVNSGSTYVGGPFSIAAAFGGVLPEKWGIVVENQTNAAFTATSSDYEVVYQGVYGESV